MKALIDIAGCKKAQNQVDCILSMHSWSSLLKIELSVVAVFILVEITLDPTHPHFFLVARLLLSHPTIIGAGLVVGFLSIS